MEEKDKQIYLQRLKVMEEIKHHRKFKFDFRYFIRMVICYTSLVFYNYITNLHLQEPAPEQPCINPCTKVDEYGWYKSIETIYIGKNSPALKFGNI